MLTNDELKVLKMLFSDITFNPTIRNLSILLKQKYPQTFRTVKMLEKKELIILKNVGKSSVIYLSFFKDNLDFITAEIERTKDLINKNKKIYLIQEKLKESGNIVSMIFGSHSKGKNKKDSDIDLLIIIPDEKEISPIEKIIKNKLSLYNIDINIISENSLFEMWRNKNELNVGNEILKSHIILAGFDYFVYLLRLNYGR